MAEHRAARSATAPAVRNAGPFLVLLVISALGVGCGSERSPRAAEPASGPPEEFGLSVAELDRRIESTEQLIATCMRDQGFAYVAIDAGTIKKAMGSDKSAPGMSAEEYLSRYGLGITTQFDKPLVVFGAGPTNTAYLDGLPPADHVAFTRALWGEAPEMNHARALEEEDFSTTGGCTRTAAESAYTTNELTGSYVNPADRRIAQDPRMITALAKWSDCMRSEAFEYATPDEVDANLAERLDAITSGQDPQALTGSALDDLHALQDEERAVAAALTSCEERFLEPVQATIEAEVYGSTS